MTDMIIISEDSDDDTLSSNLWMTFNYGGMCRVTYAVYDVAS